MKFIVAFALLTTGARAFLPASRTFVAPVVQTTKAPFSKTARSFGVDPSFFHDLPQHFDSLQNALTTVTLSDAADLAPGVADGVDVDAAAASGNGWFGFLVGPISGLLVIIHSAMVAAGMSANAWGISIIILTLTIKALTFPLTKTQLEGTSKMQAMQPAIKELQAKYQSNPEVMNQKISEFYQENEVNPLAGCIPSLVQIPVFIGLYRAVLTLAKDNVLDEGFLWLPSLEGPTFGADPAHGSDWILKGWYVLVYI
jgi:YidC/Oxa1 family membrane protein insertase